MGGVKKTISGIVTFNGTGIENVEITDKINSYATTDNLGNFSFETTKNELVLYPQKSGYIFTPTFIVVTDQTYIEFTCEKAEVLNGTLVLEQISITPTSIVSFQENNFLYKNEDKDCLKIDGINLTINDLTQISNLTNYFAPINQSTNILGENDFEFDVIEGIANLKISYELSAYFKIYNHESTAFENERVVRVNKTLDTGNLINNKFELFASGINSSHNGYSYNISFIFNFISN